MGITKTKRSGLVFNVARFHRLCKTNHMKRRRISASMPVYLAGVLEYLTAEVLELAGSVAREMKSKRISPRHVYLAVMNDEDLAHMFKQVTIPGAGVVPKIRPELIKGAADSGATASTSAASARTSKVQRTPATTAARSVNVKSKASVPALKKTASLSKATLTGSATILSERSFPGSQKLSVLQGNIIHVKCDAMVHPCGGSVSFAGQVGGWMTRVAGAQLEQETQKKLGNRNLSVSQACAGPATGLQANHVIHVCSPHWRAGDASCVQQLERAVQNIMKTAEENGCKNIALPSIASGGAGFPKQTAAETILRTIKLYMDAHPTSTVKHVYFVLFDKESVDVYVNELGRLDISMTKK